MSLNITLAAIVAALLIAPAAMAEQYVVQFDAPLEQPHAGLLESLKIVEIDAFTHGGAHYLVIEARDEGYVAAYLYAIRRSPTALHSIGADWTGSGLSGLTLEQRLPFLAPAPCTFCSS